MSGVTVMYVGIYFILYLVRIDKTARRDVTVCGASANFKQNTRGAEHGGAEDGSDRSFVTVHTYMHTAGITNDIFSSVNISILLS